MSDKSKLGFNINPKNYDELNSTDNLITSGSDSGWLGKKLQGDDSNDLYLSKINPLFDKELYEKYRPGVNTNDGSVNQDIWGYKCFNSPVSFGQSAYILPVCTNMNMQNKVYYSNYEYTNPNIGYTIKSAKTNIVSIHSEYNHDMLSYLRSIHGYKSYDEYCNQPFDTPEFQASGSEWIVNTKKVHRKTNDIDDISDSTVQIGNQSKHCNASFTSRITSDIYGELQYTQPDLEDPDGEAYFSLYDRQKYNSINDSRTVVTSNNDLYTYTTSISGISSFYQSAGEYGLTERYEDIVNKQSTIILDSSFLNTDISDAVDFDNYDGHATITLNTPIYHAPRHCLNYNGRIGLEVNENYTIAVNSGASQNVMKSGYAYLEKDNISIGVTNNINPNASNPYIKIDGTDNSITIHAEKLNLPPVTVSNVPFADRAGIASDAQAITYLNSNTLATTKLLIVDSENVILPNGNKEISIGNNDHRLNSVYAENFYGTATLAKSAKKATYDYCGNDIIATYVNKLNYYRNDIQSYNAIVGSGERLFFFPEPCIENSVESPEDIPKPHISIGALYEDNGITGKNVFSWTSKDNSVTRKCTISSKYDYDVDKSTAYFRVYPEKACDTDIADIGMAGATWSNIWCKRLLCDEVYSSQFPTIAGSTDGTSVGNIRLLCIRAPLVSTTETYELQHGSTIENPMQLGGKQFTIHIANLRIVDNSRNYIGVTGEHDTVEGVWRLLSSALVVANSANIAVYTPVLAMRVE